MAGGRETSLLADEAERGERREPGEPLRRVRDEREFAELWADDHLLATRPVFDQGDQTGAGLQFGWVQRSPK